MNSKKTLALLCVIVLLSMLIATTWASTFENVFAGGKKIVSEPWGVATLADTYFAFITFYVWVFYKEVKPISKIIWLVLILTLGNFAMATYVLWQLYKLPTEAPASQILLRSKSEQTF